MASFPQHSFWSFIVHILPFLPVQQAMAAFFLLSSFLPSATSSWVQQGMDFVESLFLLWQQPWGAESPFASWPWSFAGSQQEHPLLAAPVVEDGAGAAGCCAIAGTQSARVTSTASKIIRSFISLAPFYFSEIPKVGGTSHANKSDAEQRREGRSQRRRTVEECSRSRGRCHRSRLHPYSCPAAGAARLDWETRADFTGGEPFTTSAGSSCRA